MGALGDVELAGDRVNNWWFSRTFGRDVCVINTELETEMEGAGKVEVGYSEAQNYRTCDDFALQDACQKKRSRF